MWLRTNFMSRPNETLKMIINLFLIFISRYMFLSSFHSYVADDEITIEHII